MCVCVCVCVCVSVLVTPLYDITDHLHTDMEGIMEWTHGGYQEAIHETRRLLHVGQLSSRVHETKVPSYCGSHLSLGFL